MKMLNGLVLGVSVFAATVGNAWAKDALMTVRAAQPFDVTLEQAQTALQDNGFKVAHIQRCDKGLEGMGYDTDKYRVIFFGRLGEVRALTKRYPQLIPLFPFKLAVYAEGDDTLISVMDPEGLSEALQADPALADQLATWSDEFESVLAQVRDSKAERKQVLASIQKFAVTPDLFSK